MTSVTIEKRAMERIRIEISTSTRVKPACFPFAPEAKCPPGPSNWRVKTGRSFSLPLSMALFLLKVFRAPRRWLWLIISLYPWEGIGDGSTQAASRQGNRRSLKSTQAPLLPAVRPFIGFLQQGLDLPRRQGADQYPGRHQSLPLAIHATPNLENNDPLAKRKNRAIM